MSSWKIIFLSVASAVISVLILQQFLGNKVDQADTVDVSQQSTLHQRVIDRGTIRCGYLVYHPALIVDPNTGELSGIFYDFMNEIGRKLSLKVEWVEEAGWGGFINDLKIDRYDMMCTTAWKNSARAREATPIDPLYYSAVSTWVSKSDNRFDDDIYKLNDPQFTLATIDGSTPDLIKDTDFPKASEYSLTELSPYSDLALGVATGKADGTFLEQYIAKDFLKNNPDTIKEVGQPVRLYGNVMWIKKGEPEFRSMINTAIEELLATGYLEKLFKTYNVPEGSYLLPAKPYRTE